MDVSILILCTYIGHGIKAECLALVCAPCLEQLSDEARMKPLGTCKTEGHIKVHIATLT